MFIFANIITETMDHNEIAKLSISQSLSWTHYIRLMRISDPKERASYKIEAKFDVTQRCHSRCHSRERLGSMDRASNHCKPENNDR